MKKGRQLPLWALAIMSASSGAKALNVDDTKYRLSVHTSTRIKSGEP